MEREAKLMRFVSDYMGRCKQAPTIAEMSQFMSLEPGSVEHLLKGLESKGLMLRMPGRTSRIWEPAYRLLARDAERCAMLGIDVTEFKDLKLKEQTNSERVITKAPIRVPDDEQRGAILEDEDFAIAKTLGLSEQTVIEKCFGNLPIYRNFADNRQIFRERGKDIPQLIVSRADWQGMERFGVPPEAWAAIKYGDLRKRVRGLLDAEEADTKLKASMAADAKQRRENEKREQARRELRERE